MGLHQHDEVLLLLGAPGAGKGTQARFLATTLGIPLVASGDLLREHRKRGTDLGRANVGTTEAAARGSPQTHRKTPRKTQVNRFVVYFCNFFPIISSSESALLLIL